MGMHHCMHCFGKKEDHKWMWPYEAMIVATSNSRRFWAVRFARGFNHLVTTMVVGTTTQLAFDAMFLYVTVANC